MNKSGFSKNFHLIFPFDMVFNYPNTEDYDPIKVIEDFWNRYDVNQSRDHIVSLLLRALDRKEDLKEISEKELHKYSIELLHLLVAYYLVHTHDLSLEGLDIPVLPKTKISEEELKLRRANYSLFGDKKPTILNQNQNEI